MDMAGTGKATMRGRDYAAVCACFNLRKASRAVTTLYNDHLKASGLRITQLPLLLALDQAGPIPLTRLAEVLEMDRTTLTRNWSALKRRGLTTESAGSDRRNRILAITEKGRRTLTKALPLWEEAQSSVVKAMGSEDFRLLLGKLETVRRAAGSE